MNKTPVQWAINVLQNHNYQILLNKPDVIQDNPWAVVYRFETHKGFIFLKCVPPYLSLEPKVIELLRSEYQANVPFIIAENEDQHCFLMKDAGISLHSFFKQHFQVDILIQTMYAYTKLQLKSMNNIQRFLDIGVRDWRLIQLPTLYQEIIAEEVLLLDDGLSKEDLIKLKHLEPKLLSLCNQLASYKIKETFCHADFHDKNICIHPDTGETTLIDLGEVVITYPFFSFLNCLYRAKENFALTESQYLKLQIDCFEPWLELESQRNLLDILLIINQCWPIHNVLVEYRLMKSVDKTHRQKLLKQGRFAGNLRCWLDS